MSTWKGIRRSRERVVREVLLPAGSNSEREVGVGDSGREARERLVSDLAPPFKLVGLVGFLLEDDLGERWD